MRLLCCSLGQSGARARGLTIVSVSPQASCLAVSKLGLRIVEVGQLSLLPQPAQPLSCAGTGAARLHAAALWDTMGLP